MISKECFTTQWLQEVSATQKFNDKGLIEKVVRAMSLLEALVEAGCPLTFKGGSSLMLILKGSLVIGNFESPNFRKVNPP